MPSGAIRRGSSRSPIPLLKETCEFWDARLKKLPDGRLVVPDGWSPEHGPREDGVSYCQQIVWDLFKNYVAASQALGVDAAYRAHIAKLRDALLGPRIGRWGQLQEWMIRPRRSERSSPAHVASVRRLSGPADQRRAHAGICRRREKISRRARRGGRLGRPRVVVCLAERALRPAPRRRQRHRMLQMLLADRNTCANLFGLHPPMQIDGNFGITAGICEMLLQSQNGEIELLPALPKRMADRRRDRPAARGGFTVDISWKLGQVVAYRIAAADPRPVTVLVNGETKLVLPEKFGPPAAKAHASD